MDKKIEEALAAPKLTTQAGVKKFLKETRALIDEYECGQYEEESDNEATASKVRRWRSRLLAIVREHKNLPDEEEVAESSDEAEAKEGLSTLKMLNQQLLMADTNQKLLERGTLKLVGLSYSCNDIEKAIIESRKKITVGKSKEQKERRNIFIGFIFLVCVCLFILLDKFYMKYAQRTGNKGSRDVL